MKFIIRVLTLIGFGLGFSAPVHAASVQMDVRISFDLVKVSHDCIDTVGGQPDPGAGNCNYYQPLTLDQTYAGSILFSGEFTSVGGGAFGFVSGTRECTFGSIACFTSGAASGPGSQANVFSGTEISYRPFNNSLDSGFYFDLTAKTGWHAWQDDAVPYMSMGRFEFSNVQVTGLLPAAVPLPASLPFLVVGLGMFAYVKRRAA